MQIATATTLVCEPFSVKLRLAELEAPLEALTKAVLDYSAAEAMATNFQPTNAPGLLAWIRAVGTLRQALFAAGWRLSNERGSPSVVRPDGKMRIIVLGGDSRTGSKNPDTQPGTSHAKGPALDDAIEQNLEQLVMGEMLTRPALRDAKDAPVDESECVLYVLLVHCTESEVRFELSCPTVMNKGQVKRWRERIVPDQLTREPDPEKKNSSYDDASESDLVDVPLSKKKQA
jgi:hypothetical protein